MKVALTLSIKAFEGATEEDIVHIDNGYDNLIPFFVNKEASICFQSLKTYSDSKKHYNN